MRHKLLAAEWLPEPAPPEPECTYTDLVVLDAPERFHLEIGHYRDGQWLGTTFTRGGYGLTFLPLPAREWAWA